MKNRLVFWQNLILFGGLLFLLFVLNSFTNRLAQLHRLEEKRDALQTQVFQATQTQSALKTAIAYNQSEQAVDDWAHAHGLTLPGEYPVVPQPVPAAEVTPAPVSTPSVSTPLANWRAWWMLFFNER